MQLGRELDARRARADDGDVELLGPERLGLQLRADAGVDQAAMEARGLAGRVEHAGVPGGAGRAEVIGDAAHRHHQDVIGLGARRRHLGPVLVEDGRHMHLLPRAVEPDHLADPVAEMVPVGLREIIELVLAKVHAPRRDLVQQRLPEMGALLVEERHQRAAAPAQPVAEPRRELDPARAAAHDQDPRRRTLGWISHIPTIKQHV